MAATAVTLLVHRDPSELGGMRKEWTALLGRSAINTVFQTWEWNHLWWKHFGHADRLLLLTVRDSGNEVLGIAPFFCDLDEGNRKRLQFIGSTDLSDYLDFIVCREEEPPFYSALVEFLGAHPELWDKVDLHCLPENSPTLKGFRDRCSRKGFRENLTVEDVCPQTALPSSWEEFLAGMTQKERHEIRRKINKIHREAEEYRYVTADSASFSKSIDAFLELHRKSDTSKMAFMDQKKTRFFREMAWTFLQAGWLELSFLEANHSKLASLLNFRYGGTVYVYNSGYDPQFGHWSPGWVLISHSIQDAIERGLRNYDFLRGNESYKYRFRAKDSEIYRYTIHRQ
ncbi:MAG: GNAT family N-acetyltransferase [Proteobacteria bacterium]|nr:GNAT family N-acetyltransferase [Pseudomonadota bacterium]